MSHPRKDYEDFKALAPDIHERVLALSQLTTKAGLEKELLELVKIRASQINGCAFCLDMHANEARRLGETQQRLDCVAAFREAPFFSARERATLAWAEALTHVSGTRAPDDVYAEVKKHFTDKELVDLTAAIGMINLWNRMSIAFRTEPKERK